MTTDPNEMPEEIFVWNGDEVSTYVAETQRFNDRQTKYIRSDLAPTSQWRDALITKFEDLQSKCKTLNEVAFFDGIIAVIETFETHTKDLSASEGEKV